MNGQKNRDSRMPRAVERSMPDHVPQSHDIKSYVSRPGFWMRRFPRLLRVSLALSLAMCAGRRALGAEVDWTAPAPCPTRDMVERRIRDAIAMPLEKAAQIRFVCRITVTREKSYRLELRVGDQATPRPSAPRIFEAPSCDQVADTAAVAMALALGADAPESSSNDSKERRLGVNRSSAQRDVAATDQPKRERPTPAEPRQDQSGHAKETPVTSASRARTSAASPGVDPWWVVARIGPIIDQGSLPGIAVAPQVAFELGFRAVSARLSGAYFAEKRSTLADGSGGDFSLWGVTLGICGRTPRAHAHGRVCAGIELGQMAGVGAGNVLVKRRSTTTWVAPEVDLSVVSAPWLAGMRAYLGVLAGVPLTRRYFTLGGKEDVHRADSVVWRLNAGLEIDWQ